MVRQGTRLISSVAVAKPTQPSKLRQLHPPKWSILTTRDTISRAPASESVERLNLRGASGAWINSPHQLLTSMRRVRWYVQSIDASGEPGPVLDVGPITLRDALIVFERLQVVPETPAPGTVETLGFEDESGSFLEFVKLGEDEYQARYENPSRGEARMGVLSKRKSIEMIVDFFEGREPRWKNELEPF